MDLVDLKAKWISSFIELLPDAVALVNKDGEISLVNTKFYSALKAPSSTVLKERNLLDLLHDHDRRSVLVGLERCHALKDEVDINLVRCCTLGCKLTSSSFDSSSLLLNSHGDEDMILVVLKR